MEGAPIDEAAARTHAENLGFDWHYRRETGSTNTDAISHFDRHRRDVIAFGETQSAGRGRRGKSWISPYARNIYCTLGLRKSIDAERQGLLSIVTGLALRCALKKGADVDASLKWPNDILIGERKLGGILIESRALGRDDFFFAIGFGINVLMQVDELDAIPQPATSLSQVSGRPLDRTLLLMHAIESVAVAIRAFEPAAVTALVDEFSRADAYHGATVEVLAGDDRRQGINLGISDDGRLRLQTVNGVELHAAAEISLRSERA